MAHSPGKQTSWLRYRLGFYVLLRVTAECSYLIYEETINVNFDVEKNT
jgi:hypothetical protein